VKQGEVSEEEEAEEEVQGEGGEVVDPA